MSLSKFFRGLIAITIAFSVAFITLSQPVLAESNVPNNLSYITQSSVNQIDSGSMFLNGDQANLDSSQLTDDFAREMVKAAGNMLGGIVVCYTLDGIATLFFPPAAGAIPLCSALPTLAGGTLATKATDAVLKAF